MADPVEEIPVNKDEETVKSDKVASDVEMKTEEGELVEDKKENGVAEADDKNENSEDVSVKVPVPLTPEQTHKLVRQMEYYFGNYNLPRDKFLQEELKKDDGWIKVSVLTTFKRLASITTDEDLILEALTSSELLETNLSEKKLRRLPSKPLPESENIREESICRTIYLKGFKKDNSVTLDLLLEFFKQYGTYETVIMRRFYNRLTKEKGFKGSILIVYPDEESANKLMEVEEIMFQNAPLLRKWYSVYLVEKEKEMKERRAMKEARAAKRAEGDDKTPAVTVDPKPNGTYLHLSGLKNTTSREDIRAALSTVVDDVAFVGLSRGDEEGYVRLGTEFSNMEAVKKLLGKIEILETEVTVRAVTGDEEVTQIKLAATARANMMVNSNKRKRNFGGGGRGGRGGFKKRKY